MQRKKIWAKVLMTLLAVLTSVGAWAQTPLLTSGKCGVGDDHAGVLWSFNETTKTLTISLEDGYTNGLMASWRKNYDYDDWGFEDIPAPWRKYTDHNEVLHNGPDDLIEHIVVEEGVTRIGDYAFYGLSNLKDITLASTVRDVWTAAMKSCPKLTSAVCLCPAYISGLTEAFDGSDQLTIYAIKTKVYSYQYNLPDANFEGFLLTGNGYKATPKEATRELLDVQKSSRYDSHCTLTLNGDHTATINGKDYTIKSGTELSASYYNGVIKEGTTKRLDFDEVTETGEYRYKVNVEDVFADEANEDVNSDLFTVVSSPASGEGWSFNIDKATLTISGNVTGEPWKPFAGNIQNVIVEKGVTKMPENAFTDQDAYDDLRLIFLRSTSVVELNGAFGEKYKEWDDELGKYVEKDHLWCNIHVPSSVLANYQETYASWQTPYKFLACDFSVTLPASGVMTFSKYSGLGYKFGLDFSHADGLKAYYAAGFVPATGKVIMERVKTAKDGEGLVLKGTPNTTYTIEKSPADNKVDNLLEGGNDDVDPTEYGSSWTYLYLDGTEFKKFTESKDLTDQAYLELRTKDYASATTPITMFFSDEEVLTAGIVNGNCYWSYDADTKTLTLSGDNADTGGFVQEYDPDSSTKPAPWRTWKTEEGVMHMGIDDGIEHIVVENGVESIGSYAFYGLKNLESVSLAPSVESLYDNSMQGCPKLKTVVCAYWGGILIHTNAFGDNYSVANVGETYYVPNYQIEYYKNWFKAFNNVKVEGFSLSDGTLKVDFYEDPLTWKTDHYTGELSMIGCYEAWIEGAKATINGTVYTYEDDIKLYGIPARYRKDNQDTDLKEKEVTEAGKYYVKVTVDGYFADEAKNTAISEHYVDIYVAATSGTGWNYNRDNRTLTISGNVTGEPWKVFKDYMEYVVVEEGVTQLPEKAFYNYYNLVYNGYVLIKGAGVDLNKAFLYWDDWEEAEYLLTNIYVPASSVADYSTAYASYMWEYGCKFLSSDISIDITSTSEGIRTYSDYVALDLSACEGLQAYAITGFNATTGTLTLKPVTKLAAYGGYLLMGNTGTYTAKVTAGVDKEEDNMLTSNNYVNPENTYEGVTYTNLILAGTGANRGFHPVSEIGTLPNHVAYLSIKKDDFDAWKKAHGAAKIQFEFEDAEPTAIEEVTTDNAQQTTDSWYTLSGVKLTGEPTTKGVYIHNGKKVAIK